MRPDGRIRFLIGLAVATFGDRPPGCRVRRNLLVVVMCLEILLNAVVLAFVAFAARAQALEAWR